MPQLIENKQNDPVLIANFEPNEIATKSEGKTTIRIRKHCADKPAQKVEIQTRKNCASEAATPKWRAGQKGKSRFEVKKQTKGEEPRALPLLRAKILWFAFGISLGQVRAKQRSTAWWLRAFWTS
jgi:hypothetical protein